MKNRITDWIRFLLVCSGLILFLQGEMPVFGAEMEQEEAALGADHSGFASAKSISVNTAVSGSLPTSGTVNYYKFTLPRAGYVYMEFNHGYVDRDSDVWNFGIYNSSFEYIMDRNSNGKKMSATYNPVGFAAGTYYLKISAVRYNWSDISYNFVVHSISSDNWGREKNESFETANVFGANSVVYGSIRESDDIDFYRFDVAQDGMAYLEFNHDYVDDNSDFWNIKIYNQEFEELMSRNSEGKKMEKLYGKIGIPKGIYYIKVTAVRYHWSDVSYNFTFHTVPSAGWEKEKNESYQTANTIATNSVINGSIRESNDQDFYKIDIPYAGYVNFDFGHTYVDSDSEFWTISIYNGSYEWIFSRNSKGKVLNQSYAMVGIPAGIYYVKITAMRYSWSDAAYSIKVNYTHASDWETELNENFETSDFISMDTYINGSIRDNDDKDYYKLDVQRPGYISILFGHDVVDNDSSLWKIRLYDSSFNEIRNECCTGKAEMTTSPYFASVGMYYVRINGDWSWSDATYRFKVTYNFTDSTPWISAEVTGKQQVKLSWSGVSNANGYEIYRAVGKGKYTLLKTIANGSARSYTDRNVALGKTYSYKVRGYYADGSGKLYSDFSPKRSVKVALAKVKITKAKSLSSKRVQIVWKKVSGASGYEVYRAKTKNGRYKKVGTLSSGKKVSFTDKKVSRKKTYYYKVRAYKKVGGKRYYGEYSGKKKVRVK